MSARVAFLIVLASLVLGGCAKDEREWMKVDRRYTTEEFRRDHRECSRKGDLDDACMRERGWLSVNPSKSEAPPPEPSTPRTGRGRSY